MSYDNKGSGVLFINKNKNGEKQPDYTGKITLQDGTEKELSAWNRVSGAGNQFISIKISDKFVKDGYKAKAKEELPSGFTDGLNMDDFDESIPF